MSTVLRCIFTSQFERSLAVGVELGLNTTEKIWV